ncbi:MAG: hypothetical protein JNN00_00275 [Chitinophagaceae bacterium]|nr:hypothetical protein [Chitinophagaceae bacterium]
MVENLLRRSGPFQQAAAPGCYYCRILPVHGLVTGNGFQATSIGCSLFFAFAYDKAQYILHSKTFFPFFIEQFPLIIQFLLPNRLKALIHKGTILFVSESNFPVFMQSFREEEIFLKINVIKTLII